MSTQNSSLIRTNIHLIIFVFRLVSLKRPEKLEMPDIIKSQNLHSGFKGELIENELYQSADNVIDCKSNMDTVCDILEDSNTAPCFREKTPIQLEIEDQYSYPTKWTKQFKTKTTQKNFKDKSSNLRLERKQNMSVQNRDHDFFQCVNYFKRT